MSTIDTIPSEASVRPRIRRFASIMLFALGWLDIALERRRSRQALGELDDRLLKDVGLSRADADIESRRPFWR